MAVKRRQPKRQTPRISDEAVEAYRARDYRRLHLALGLPPWHVSPLPLDDEALGCDQGKMPRFMRGTVAADTWKDAQLLQCELERLSR